MKLRQSERPRRALTFVEVLVVVAAIVLLVLVLVPVLARPRSSAMRITCSQNLKQIGLSFRIWAEDDAGKGDNAGKYPMRVPAAFGGTKEKVAGGAVWPHFQVMSNELNTPRVLVCPEDRPRMEATGPSVPRVVGSFSFLTNSPVSYFIGVDAEETRTNHFLAGDDNLLVGGQRVPSGMLNLWTNSAVGWSAERHGKVGNICFADGSVHRVDQQGLRRLLKQSGVATNRLAIP